MVVALVDDAISTIFEIILAVSLLADVAVPSRMSRPAALVLDRQEPAQHHTYLHVGNGILKKMLHVLTTVHE
jgi:hypothetical protein